LLVQLAFSFSRRHAHIRHWEWSNIAHETFQSDITDI
jgi:hypothetical protein